MLIDLLNVTYDTFILNDIYLVQWSMKYTYIYIYIYIYVHIYIYIYLGGKIAEIGSNLPSQW